MAVCTGPHLLTRFATLPTLFRSSSTIWYSFSFIESIQGVSKGDRTWQVAFGSGFKVRSFLSAAGATAPSCGPLHLIAAPMLTPTQSLMPHSLTDSAVQQRRLAGTEGYQAGARRLEAHRRPRDESRGHDSQNRGRVSGGPRTQSRISLILCFNKLNLIRRIPSALWGRSAAQGRRVFERGRDREMLYKRDLGILLLSVWTVFVSLRREGPITFQKVRVASSPFSCRLSPFSCRLWPRRRSPGRTQSPDPPPHARPHAPHHRPNRRGI